MTMENTFAVFPGELEIRENETGRGRTLTGRFPYSPGPGRAMATVSDRGTRTREERRAGNVRKERIEGNAFGWQLERFAEVQKELGQVLESAVDTARAEVLMQELERRNVHILSGHSYDKPLGDMLKGTARVRSTNAAVEFEVDLPDDADMPTYMLDVVKEIRTKRAGGISPGFMVPPRNVVANAERLEPEPGNPDVQVRVINQAVLYELSIVTRPAYSSTSVDLRAEDFPNQEPERKRVRRWL